MSIETVGSFKNMLNNYSTKEWVKKTNMDITTPLKGFNELGLQQPGDASNARSFTELLANSISEVNNLQHEANTAMQKLSTGKTKNLHETLLAVEKAEIAFKTMNQVRSKVIDAYREIMKMQI